MTTTKTGGRAKPSPDAAREAARAKADARLLSETPGYKGPSLTKGATRDSVRAELRALIPRGGRALAIQRGVATGATHKLSLLVLRAKDGEVLSYKITHLVAALLNLRLEDVGARFAISVRDHNPPAYLGSWLSTALYDDTGSVRIDWL